MPDDWQKSENRVRSMRDCAAETRALAENMKTRGARTGLLELAASYDRKADEVEAAISQITDPFPGPSPQPALAWRFFYSLMPRTGAGRFLLNLRQQLSKTLMGAPVCLAGFKLRGLARNYPSRSHRLRRVSRMWTIHTSSSPLNS